MLFHVSRLMCSTIVFRSKLPCVTASAAIQVEAPGSTETDKQQQQQQYWNPVCCSSLHTCAGGNDPRQAWKSQLLAMTLLKPV